MSLQDFRKYKDTGKSHKANIVLRVYDLIDSDDEYMILSKWADVLELLFFALGFFAGLLFMAYVVPFL